MKMNVTALVLCIVTGAMTCLAVEPSGTLPVWTTEGSDTLVNTDPIKTSLQMTVITPQKGLKVGQKIEVSVNICNTSGSIEIVYMPGLELTPVFVPNKKTLRPDEYGPPLVFGRLRAKDERLNFVVLMGGDSYARTYRWTPPDDGSVTFRATYRNKRNGAEIGVKAWTGELRSSSKALRISKQ